MILSAPVFLILLVPRLVHGAPPHHQDGNPPGNQPGSQSPGIVPPLSHLLEYAGLPSRQTIYLGTPEDTPSHHPDSYITETDKSSDACVVPKGTMYGEPMSSHGRNRKLKREGYTIMDSDVIAKIPEIYHGDIVLIKEGTPVRSSYVPILSLPVRRPGSRIVNKHEQEFLRGNVYQRTPSASHTAT